MPDYRKMYLHLFNAVTDALQLMDKGSKAADILRTAQCDCEEIYIDTAPSAVNSEE